MVDFTYEHLLGASNEELMDFAWLTGNNDVHALRIRNTCTTNPEIPDYTDIPDVYKGQRVLLGWSLPIGLCTRMKTNRGKIHHEKG